MKCQAKGGSGPFIGQCEMIELHDLILRSIPEKICWNVLGGISNALRYLHHGTQQTSDPIRAERQEFDWQPITMVDINPMTSQSPSPL